MFGHFEWCPPPDGFIVGCDNIEIYHIGDSSQYHPNSFLSLDFGVESGASSRQQQRRCHDVIKKYNLLPILEGRHQHMVDWQIQNSPGQILYFFDG
jgi:hypothetical protein